MNNSEFYTNKDGIASATWPDPVGDYPHPSVPQGTHPDLVSAPECPSTAGSYVPDLNAAGDVERVFADLLAQVDCVIQVSNQCVYRRH